MAPPRTLTSLAALLLSTVACAVSPDDGTSGLSGGAGGFTGLDGQTDGGESQDGGTTNGATNDTTGGGDAASTDGAEASDAQGDASGDDGASTGAVDPDAGDGSTTNDDAETGSDSGGQDDLGGSSTGAEDVDVGTQPAFGEYSHCLSNAACGAGSCMTLGNPVSDGYCALTCSGVGNPAPCGDAPPSSPLAPTCYGADNGMGGAVYVCALDCAGDQPCPAGMECFSVPQAAAAGGGNVEFCA